MPEPKESSGLFAHLGNRLFARFRGNDTRPASGSTLYLHIGTHKTGTSALQLFLSRNRSQLLANGVEYPESGCTPEGAHHFVANALKGPPYPLIAPELSAGEYLNILRRNSSNCPTVLLSSEIFMRLVPGFRPAWTTDLSSLQRLSTVAQCVKPVVYLRPQAHYLESFYRQTVLEQSSLTPAEFVEQCYLDYLEICRQLEQVFGRENLVVRVYDKHQFHGGNLFTDFLSILGVELDSRFEGSDLQANDSLGPDAIEFRRLVNCLGADLKTAMAFNPVLHRYSQRYGGVQRDTCFIDADLSAGISKKSERVNTILNSTYLKQGDLGKQELYAGCSQDIQAYAGLDDAALENILEFMAQDSPELVPALACIACESKAVSREGRDFAMKVAARL